MNSKELRQKFLNFFEKKGHKVIPSSSLVPSETDATVLFTTAGMQPLVPFLNGEQHPAGEQLVNIQKCIRTDDIDEVGDKTHNTFFEMLGYWSLGVYWKKEAINLTYEFLAKELGLDLQKLAVSCFEGDESNNIPKDTESAEIWKSLGIDEKRIAYLGYKDNFWGPVGAEGPCGPDTEIFYWTGENSAPEDFNSEDKNWVEIGNDVFMAYKKTGEEYLPLTQRNVDFGSGFERLLMTLNGFDEIYKTDLFMPSIQKIEELSDLKYGDKTDEDYISDDKQCWVDVREKFRIIADHIRAATFALNDGVLPSNKDVGYIVRRLIRRAIVKAQAIGIKENFTKQLAEKVFEVYDDIYFNCHSEQSEESIVSGKCKLILDELEKEENKFRKTLEAGLRKLEELASFKTGGNNESEKTVKISGKEMFDLFQSFGLPLEITTEECKRLGIPVDDAEIKDFYFQLDEHRKLSQTASAGMFKGGLADSGEETTKLHTAAHLLLAALRKVLGEGVTQKGSNITAERLRFDFSYGQKLTDDQIKKVEDLVNENIKKDLLVGMEEMKLEDAHAGGAMGVFDSKYGDMVKVYTIGSSAQRRVEPMIRPSTSSGSREFFSREICGGPHVENTGVLDHFKITKEESSSAGIRRIKAILE